MSLRSSLHIFLRQLPCTSSTSEKRTLLSTTGFMHLESRLQFDVPKILFFNELLDQLVSEGQVALVLFLNKVADSPLYGLEDRNQLHNFARQICNLNQQEFYIEFRGCDSSFFGTAQTFISETHSVKNSEIPISSPESPKSVNPKERSGKLRTIVNIFTTTAILLIKVSQYILSLIIKIWRWQEEDRSRNWILLVLAVILSVAGTNIVRYFQGNLCRFYINRYDTEISQTVDDMEKQKKYFERGFKQYECRDYLIEPSVYKASFNAAVGYRNNQNSDIYSLFVNKARRMREHALTIPSSDDFEFSRFLFEKATEINDQNAPYLIIELGKTYQAEFELETKDNISLSDPYIEKIHILIQNSLDRYQTAFYDGAEKASTAVYIGYAMIMYGDFLRKYSTPPQSSSNEAINEELNVEEHRIRVANSQYETAINWFRYSYKTIRNINPKDDSANIQNDALLGESIAFAK